MVPESVLQEVLQHFVTSKNLRLSGSRTRNLTDQHRGFFVWRRANTLGTTHSAWLAESGLGTLKGRIESEFQAVEAFLNTWIGTRASPGPLLPVLGGSGDIAPAHLDLGDLAHRRTTESPGSSQVRSRARRFSRFRRNRVIAIVWRAAALHDEVWQPSADLRTATLKLDNLVAALPGGPLSEYMDRRLRVIERMHFNIADRSGQFGGMGSSRWNATGATGPWLDGFRVRIFEYPRMPGFLRNQIGDTNIGPASTRGLLDPAHDAPGHTAHPGADPHWTWNETNTRLEWRVAPAAGVGYAWRMPPALRGNWQPHATRSYRIDLVPAGGTTGAQAIDDLFDHPRLDIWERAWLWCDHVIAACNIEALLLGLRRRFTDGEDRFNDLVTGADIPPGGAAPYVALHPIIGTLTGIASDYLMGHANDRHFENLVIEDADLQVGDHLIFWNHILYDLISTGDWRLENALVMYVRSDPRGGIRPRTILLQGHGTSIRSYPLYQRLIANKLRPAMRLAREKIRQEVAADATISEIPWRDTKLVKWSPYDNFRRVRFPGHGVLNLGAWWVEVPLGETSWPTTAAAVAGLPKSAGHGVGRLASPGSGYNPPPRTSDAVYMPVFEPRITARVAGERLNGWDAFFERRRTSAIAPVLMNVVEVTGSLIPGLYRRGDRTFPIARPKATP